jgi:quinol-cytochrome oxidoreductase complex cytochrome b subunit
MNCPNCNQPYEEGATVCPNCGTLLPSSAPAPVSPPPAYQPPAPVAPPPPAYPQAYPPAYPTASSSSMAKASLWLGITGVGLIALYFILNFAFVGAGASITNPTDISRVTGGLIALAVVAVIFFFASPVAGLLGLIFGIIALNQEKTRPTQSGRTQAIVGIVLSCVPLLCCVAIIIVMIIGISALSSSTLRY